MKILISHTTALQIVRPPSFTALDKVVFQHDKRSSEYLAAPKRSLRTQQIDSVKQKLWSKFGVKISKDNPLHYLVSTQEARHRAGDIFPHLFTGKINAKDLMDLGDEVYCIAPQMLPFFFAKGHSDLELAYFMSELCGTYSLQVMGNRNFSQRSVPLVTSEKMFIAACRYSNLRGARLVKKSVELFCGASASPMETKLYMRLAMPFSKGGYGFDDIILNDVVMLRRFESMYPVLRERRPDFLLGTYKSSEKSEPGLFKLVAIDYNGAYHSEAKQAQLDEDRANEFLACGIKDYVLRKSTYDNLTYMDNLADIIRQDLGIKKQKMSASRLNEYRKRRRRLWRELEELDTSDW